MILLQKPCFSENDVRGQKKNADFKGFADILFSDKAQIHVKSDFLQQNQKLYLQISLSDIYDDVSIALEKNHPRIPTIT